jgi:tRNA-Thr(GGU) m(6)t(6)A37 methyltransferase TsaA
MEYNMHPIGIIRTPFTEKGETPIQSSRSQTIGSVEVYPEFEQGLQDIEKFSYLYLLYVFHHSSGYSLKIKPFLDNQEHGLFSTRYPYRPNPIGISVVQLLTIEGTKLKVKGVDVLDQTPLLDIKPYVPEFDVRTVVKTGWFETRSKK